MMNLVIDYGNSAAKVGIFDQHELVEKHLFSETTELRKFLENFSADNFIISSVKADALMITEWAVNIKKKFVLSQTLPLPIEIQYATPQTLGVDRIAGVCGAKVIFPNNDCLVIDTGTCITYDMITKDGHFIGGGISPGLSMRFQAVHTFTTKLPLVKPKDDVPLIGNSTESCIQSGVINGLLEEIEGIIRLYRVKFADLQVILCGGDTGFFENKLKASIFASPELVLSGLNSILIYNVNR
ncbi:MAG: type III pantothenate kinase [Cyclobacteriaceae bacterium]|nr:type III pantothenate kinase [Cyclobacteriaceae bacterium]